MPDKIENTKNEPTSDDKKTEQPFADLSREDLVSKLQGLEKGMGSTYREMKDAQRQSESLEGQLKKYEDADKQASELLPKRDEEITNLKGQIQEMHSMDRLRQTLKQHSPVSDRVADLLYQDLSSKSVSEDNWDEAIEVFKVNEPTFFTDKKKEPVTTSKSGKVVSPTQEKKKVDPKSKEGLDALAENLRKLA